MITPILALHIAAGSIALAFMWIPMFAPKGARLHRRSGWVFVTAMAVVSVTALLLASARVIFDPRPEARDAGLFLLVVAVLTGTSVSSGVRVLRYKRRQGRQRGWWDLGLAVLLTTVSSGLAAYAMWRAQPLFMAFAALGITNGIGELRYWLRSPSTPMHWWFQHMSGMLGGCVAAITAFLVNTSNNVGMWPLAAWLGPSLIGIPVIAVWTRYYKHRFSGAQQNFGIFDVSSGARSVICP